MNKSLIYVLGALCMLFTTILSIATESPQFHVSKLILLTGSIAAIFLFTWWLFLDLKLMKPKGLNLFCHLFGHKWIEQIKYSEYCKRCGATKRAYAEPYETTFFGRTIHRIVWKVKLPPPKPTRKEKRIIKKLQNQQSHDQKITGIQGVNQHRIEDAES